MIAAMNLLVSIIIPIYNLENYIEYCLNSVVNQTYKELEILCVDDGSTDKSAEIIKRFASSDSRIKYFYQDNAGVSAARNKGLDEATGEYVMFVDGDDYIHSQMVERFYNEAKNNHADVVLSDLKVVGDYNRNLYENIDANTGIELELKDLWCTYKVGYTVAGNMISSSLIGSNRFFTNISIGEDGCFMLTVCLLAKKFFLVEQQYYFYYTRNDSATHSLYCLSKSTIIDAGDYLYKTIKQYNQKDLSANFLEGIYKSIYENRILCREKEYRKTVENKCKVIGRKYLFDLITCRYIPLKKRIAFALCFKIPSFYKVIRVILDPSMLKYYKNKEAEND